MAQNNDLNYLSADIKLDKIEAKRIITYSTLPYLFEVIT